MTRRNIPSLRALAAFEAAGRLGGFRLAAEELGITRSAVSHQIKALEDWLGVTLFSRDSRRAALTNAGQVYFPAVREAFDQIEAQTQFIRPSNDDNELTLQVYVTVALKWLIPRLHEFERKYPQVRGRISTSYFDWDFEPGNADAGFVLVRNHNPACYYRPLFRSMLRPICARSLIDGDNPIRTPADLANHKLLYVYTAEEDWNLWLEAAGVGGMPLSRTVAFDSYILAQQAAIEGKGIAMSIGPFIEEDVRSGRLATPFDLAVPHRYDWQFVCPRADRLKPKIRRMESWLIDQVDADPELSGWRLTREAGGKSA